MTTPVLSICIPTFSRAASLRKLLANLEEVLAVCGDELEVCISDNCSEDDTQQVIESFAQRMPIRYFRQASNVGATRNILGVSAMATGRWRTWVGDDDFVDKQVVVDLIAALKACPAETWFLVDASHGDAELAYFRGIRGGDYAAAEFRPPLLKEGVQPLCFMGVHIFPAAAVELLTALTMKQARPWPHIAGFLRYISDRGVHVQVWNRALVHQAGGSESLFWEAGDLADMRLDKLRIISEVPGGDLSNRLFLAKLLTREAYRRDVFSALFSWRIYEGRKFRARSLKEVLSRALALGVMGPILLPHAVLVAVLALLPTSLLDFGLRKTGFGHKKRVYIETKERLGQHDALQRGL